MARLRAALVLLSAAAVPAERPPYFAPTERPSSLSASSKPAGKRKKPKGAAVDRGADSQPSPPDARVDPRLDRGQCATPGSCDGLPPPPGRPEGGSRGRGERNSGDVGRGRDERGDRGGHADRDEYGDRGGRHGGGDDRPAEIDAASDDSEFVEYISGIETWPYEDMLEGLQEISETASITTPMQRHLERIAVQHAFADAITTSLRYMGNYSDGTPAGSPQWIGDHGAQDPRDPSYASLGSVLDVSTEYSQAWEGSTEFGGKPSWIASLIHRREIVEHDEHLPCRVDLFDDYDIPEPYDDDSACFIGVTADDYVAVRGTNEKKYEHWAISAEWAVLERGYYIHSPVMELEIKDEDGSDRKFDTIVANGALASIHEAHDLDLVLEKLVSFLKPGGVIYLIGIEPIVPVEGPGRVFNEILDVIDSVKGLSGVRPYRNMPAIWINRNLHRLGLNVFSSTVFPTEPSFYDIQETVNDALNWVEENQPSGAIRKQYQKLLSSLMDKAREATKDGPVYAGERQYIIAAELPADGKTKQSLPKVDEPTIYEPKPAYARDKEPKVEKLDETPVPRGKMVVHKWGNGDSYDGLGARIALPPHLVPTITKYIKDLGLWDMMIDMIKNDPMPQDSTRFFNVTSPYGGEGRNFSWSAKRPDNFYASDSDMHWFDIADEASHEDSIRALAKGGFDEVLNAIGEYLGLEHLVTFSIGLLAVTKADKGYVHVDFFDSGRRAFNFLINLDTPGDEPELTVIEEDMMGNFRRGQIKYTPQFGVLNGDAGMHATNECNHDASGGVRLTASIFITDLKEASLEEVAEHDNYYFPFGNRDWIWAQRGRHWNKDSSVSLINDKGRLPFEPVDGLMDCKTRVGKNKEKCWVNSKERKKCFKTCGFFMSDEEYQPGAEREKVFGW